MNPMDSTAAAFRRATRWLALMLLCLWSAYVFADGKVYPPKAFPASVNIPDQSALLIWSNGVERLVIETRFVGEGTNFAWVVPLPSVPEIEPATTGLFPTLRTCLQPEVLHAIPPYWAVAMFVCSLFWLLATVRSDEEASGTDLIGCLLTAAGAAFATGFGTGAMVGFLLLFLLLMYVVHRVRNGYERPFAIFVPLFLVLLPASMLLPASLGTRGTASASAGESRVHVLARKIVGVFETTVITANDPKALLHWLDENGFAADKASEPVVEQHVRDGWVFVAARVNRDSAQNGAATPHPLSFTFKTSQAIYPLRLTGVGSALLELELFVVGSQRAEIDGFKVSECHQIVKESEARMYRRQVPAGHFGDRVFNNWAGNLPVITRLEAKLAPQKMAKDALISWHDYGETRTQVYSRQGAAVVGANWSVPFIFIIAVTLGMLVQRGVLLPAVAWKYAVVVTLVCVLLGVAVFLSLPKVEVRLEHFARLRGETSLMNVVSAIDNCLRTNQPINLNSVRQAAVQALSKMDGKQLPNHLQGGVIHEEDSPGNFTLRETAHGVDLIAHDIHGGEVVLFTFEDQAPSDTN